MPVYASCQAAMKEDWGRVCQFLCVIFLRLNLCIYNSQVLLHFSKFIVSQAHAMFSLWLFMCGICIIEAIDIWECIAKCQVLCFGSLLFLNRPLCVPTMYCHHWIMIHVSALNFHHHNKHFHYWNHKTIKPFPSSMV